ncbi:MAG: hypothetical protein KVP17_000838 [Porospora cf. gigantea B]|uniref:uncharacterized protein n=2 Tax=Porospora cf. gigantea B TaxID=2853592 RepID=UPI003571F08F|nr:MAG: hypothetical protein KVP17_000838 [Porospora cf. gigantea B]
MAEENARRGSDSESRRRRSSMRQPGDRIQVSAQRSAHAYVRLVKSILLGMDCPVEEGVKITALGSAITKAVQVTELLKQEKICTTVKIETFYSSEDEESDIHASHIARILITMKKHPDFKEE